MTERPPTKILYISGYGRSGSTLLDIALGQHPRLFGAGEVAAFTRSSWSDNDYCACGAPLQSCPFWSEVVAAWSEGRGGSALDVYRADHRQVESIVAPRRLAGRLKPGWWNQRVVEPTAALFRTISERSGRPVVIDSSKLPGRGLALIRNPGVEVYAVHLVRDPRAVVWSMSKPIKRQVEAGVQRELKPKPALYTALRWMIVNLAAERLLLRAGRGQSVRVRYEDLVAHPGETIDRVLALVGETGGGLPDGIHQPVRPGHQSAGSRHRMQKELKVRIDEGWRAEMPIAKQWLVALLCAPLLRRYGYPWRAREQAPLREALAS